MAKDWIQILVPLVLEATALPTMPQRLPFPWLIKQNTEQY